MADVIRKIGRKDMPMLLSRGIFVSGKEITLRYIIPLKSERRYAVIVGKKTASRAVDRNRIKRRVYSIARKFFPERSLYVAFFPKRAVLGAEAKTLELEIKGLLKKISTVASRPPLGTIE